MEKVPEMITISPLRQQLRIRTNSKWIQVVLNLEDLEWYLLTVTKYGGNVITQKSTARLIDLIRSPGTAVQLATAEYFQARIGISEEQPTEIPFGPTGETPERGRVNGEHTETNR